MERSRQIANGKFEKLRLINLKLAFYINTPSSCFFRFWFCIYLFTTKSWPLFTRRNLMIHTMYVQFRSECMVLLYQLLPIFSLVVYTVHVYKLKLICYRLKYINNSFCVISLTCQWHLCYLLFDVHSWFVCWEG